MYTNLESTRYWQGDRGMKLNGAAVEARLTLLLVLEPISLAGPTTDVMSIAVLLNLSTAILSSQELTVDCSVVYTVGETVCVPTEKDLVSPIRVKLSFPTNDT